MIGWLAGLTGWSLMAAILGIFVMVIALVGALGMILGWLWLGAIRHNTEHDTANCPCDRCRQIRRNDYRRKKQGLNNPIPRWGERDKKPRPQPRIGHAEPRGIGEELGFPGSQYIATTELQVGMAVSMERGSVYLVATVNIHPDTGDYHLGLRNMKTNRVVLIVIKRENAGLPFWEPLRSSDG